MFKAKKWVIIVLSFFIASCDMTGKSTGANDGLGAFIFRGGLAIQGNVLRGTGQVISSGAFGSVKSARSFHLRFSLADGGSLKLAAYGHNDLTGAIEIEFSRNLDNLEVKVGGAGFEHSVSGPFKDINANAVLDFMIDIHNDHDDAAHVFVWPYISSNASSYGPDNAIINSDYFQFASDLGGFEFYDWHDFAVKGSGAFWGLELVQAQVFIYRMGPPKDNS